ncbi:MAG: hypothetical protein AB1489_04640 [Acidobacteriota bacterium]
MKTTFLVLLSLLLSISFKDCDFSQLGMPGDPLVEAEAALAAHKQFIIDITATRGVQQAKTLEHLNKVLLPDEKFLSRRENDLSTNLIVAHFQLKRSHEALQRYVNAYTESINTSDKSDITQANSVMSISLSTAREAISNAEAAIEKHKHP